MISRVMLLTLCFTFILSFNVFAQKERKTLSDCQAELSLMNIELDKLLKERDELKETLVLFRAGENAGELEKIWNALNDQIVALKEEKEQLQKKYDERTELAKEFREDIVRLTNNKNLVNDAFKSKDGFVIGGYNIEGITDNNSLHISFSFAYTNSQKKIKYLTLFFNVYDDDKNLLTCNGSHEKEVSLLLEGIIKASGSTNNYKAYKRFVNDAATCLELTRLLVEYTDGSSQTFSSQIKDMTSIDFVPCYE